MQQEMKYIYAVYQEGSISKAAEKLYMTQPALSMAIRRVENELNAVLFDRSQHPLRLTEAGIIYIQKYHEIKILEQELKNQIDDIQQLQKGELLIGGTHFILSYVLAPVLARFAQQYPKVSIRLFESSADQLDSLLLKGKIDLCIKCDECEPPLKRLDFAFRDHLLMAVPQDYAARYELPAGMNLAMIKKDGHLKAGRALLAGEQLQKLPYLVLTPGNNLHDRFTQLFQQYQIEPQVKMEIEQIVTAYHLANSGLGATLISAKIAKRNLGNKLLYYTIDSPLMVRDFYVIGRQNHYVSNTNLKFMEMLKSYYEAKVMRPAAKVGGP